MLSWRPSSGNPKPMIPIPDLGSPIRSIRGLAIGLVRVRTFAARSLSGPNNSPFQRSSKAEQRETYPAECKYRRSDHRDGRQCSNGFDR